MRLDLEGDREALAEVEHAGVLARALQDALARGGQPPQERRRVLVAAVLRPEQREDRELEVVRVAAQELPDSVRLPVGETEGAVERLFGDLRQVTQCNRAVVGAGRRNNPRRAALDASVRPMSRRYPVDARRRRAPLGRVVHVHQDRGPRARAGDARRSAGSGSRRSRSRSSSRSSPAAARSSRRSARTSAGSSSSVSSTWPLPFWLLSWGETRIDSGLASIIQGSVPIFNAVIAFGFFREVRVTGLSARRRRDRLRRRRPARRRAAAREGARRARGRRDGALLCGRPVARRAPSRRGAAAQSSRSRRRPSQRSRCCRSGSRRRRTTCPKLGDDRVGARPRHPADRVRLPALLRDHRRCGCRIRLARDVPRAADRAALRRRSSSTSASVPPRSRVSR